MRARLFCLLAFASLSLQAQIALYSLSGITPSPLGSVYGYGQVAAGDLKDVRFRAVNTGTTAITITLIKVLNTGGAGFSIVNSSSTPLGVSAGGSIDFFVRFSATAVTSYSATLQVGTVSNTVSAILLATVVPAATLSVAAPCTGPDANATISFGRIVQGSQQNCAISIQNPFPQALTVSPLTVTGAAFTTTSPSSVTIAAGQSASFAIQFSPAAAASSSGTLIVGARTYTLAGTGFLSPLPSLIWTFDSKTMASGEQHTLSLQLSAASPVAASGSVILSFVPLAGVVTNDTAVQFVATSKRIASFTVSAGETAIKLNGQPNIVFSTGTTAGKLTFTADPGIYGLSGDPSISFTLSPSSVAILSSSASRRLNDLDVAVSGFDNTYSVGSMSFSFFDRSGGAITTLPADFASSFRAFFLNQTAGSAFLMRVTFPVTGDASQVGGVEVLLNNTVGAIRTPRLNFP